MEEIRDYNLEEFEQFILDKIDSINDFELLILTGHIIVEFCVNCYLEILSNQEKANFFKENLSFDIKLKMLVHFGNIYEEDDNFYKSLKMLNQVRNGIAHSLNVKTQLLNEFLTEIYKYSEDQNLYKTCITNKDKFLVAISFTSAIIFRKYLDLKQYHK